MADATQVQRRRGTESQCDGMTPAEAEVIVDLTNDTLRVGDGLRAGGFLMPNFNHIQRQSFAYAVAGGTGNAITLTLSPALLAYADGVALEFKASNNNTGAATINVNGLGAKNIKKLSGGVLTDVASGDIVAGVVYRVTYDGTQFQVTNAEFTPPAPTGGLVKLVTYDLALAAAFPANTISVPSGYSSYRIDIQGYTGSNLTLFNGTSGNPGTALFAINSSHCFVEMIRGTNMINVFGRQINSNTNISNYLSGTPSVIAPSSPAAAGTLILYGRN